MQTIGLVVGALSALYVLTWIPIAYATGVLFPDQMLKKYPKPGQVIPLVLDFYLWTDLFLFPLLMARIVSEVGDQWPVIKVAALFILGLIAAVAFQFGIIEPGKYPCTLGGAKRTTLLGYLHIPFFATVFTVMMLFLFTTVSTSTVVFVTVMFMMIVPINMLVPLHFIRKWLKLTWAPDVFGEEPRLFWMIGGTWAGIIVLATLKLLIQQWV
jgi:hypothetical protein